METQEKCRLIDVITLKGQDKPIELFTVDYDLKQLDKQGTNVDHFN